MNLLIKYASRKFVLCLGCGVVTSALTYFGRIDGATYAVVTLGTIGAYITGNVSQKNKETDP